MSYIEIANADYGFADPGALMEKRRELHDAYVGGGFSKTCIPSSARSSRAFSDQVETGWS